MKAPIEVPWFLILISMVFCSTFQLTCPYVWSCFGHAKSKVVILCHWWCQSMWQFLRSEFKSNSINMEKYYCLIKLYGKRKQKWKEFCIVARLPLKMLKTSVKTSFVSWIILFQETFETQDVISICYGWKQALGLCFKM